MKRTYVISTASSRYSKHWPRSEMTWEAFAHQLESPARGHETQAEYFKMAKAEQDDLKDVGGYVAGTLRDDSRKKDCVEKRCMLTLDLDNIPSWSTDKVLEKVAALKCAAAVYSTRKHQPAKPRLRIILPLDMDADPEAYEAVARKAAQLIGIEWCDPTTFEPNRLMFWPSASADGEYVYRKYDGSPCSVNGLLSMYQNWHDVGEWPQTPGEASDIRRKAARQGNPTEKKGTVGLFCRAYSIEEAMEELIPGVYEATATEGRYTFLGGSTSGGAIVYENGLFLYSHHATDPCSMQLVNAFDLVRLHKFSALDDDAAEGTRVNSLPSFKAMLEFAMKDEKVRRVKSEEEEAALQEAFAAPSVSGSGYDPGWRTQLEMGENGQYVGSMDNLCKIIHYDPNLQGKIWLDVFANRLMVMGPMPWEVNGAVGERMWVDNDDAGVMWLVETLYKIKTSANRIAAAVNLEAARSSRNPVKDYLFSLKWDGRKRADTLFVDYLGAEDSEYVRAVTRKVLAAAVARAVGEGVKFDNMPILVGGQGIGKSTLIRKLGMRWFSDSLVNFEGKEAAEMIQGTWINEIGELTAMSKQESNAVKQFLSKEDDIYRAAYGRRTGKYPRRCVFIGTSNDTEFLKDTTGNRRFWPITVGGSTKGSVFTDVTQDVVDQVWAEVVMYFRLGEPLFLPSHIEAVAEEKQHDHLIQTGKEGLVSEFLDNPIPTNWYSMNREQRVQFLNGNLVVPPEKITERTRVCAMEIWEYCFWKQPGNMRRVDTLEINSILSNLDGWKPAGNTKRFGNFGPQKGYLRV